MTTATDPQLDHQDPVEQVLPPAPPTTSPPSPVQGEAIPTPPTPPPPPQVGNTKLLQPEVERQEQLEEKGWGKAVLDSMEHANAPESPPDQNDPAPHEDTGEPDGDGPNPDPNLQPDVNANGQSGEDLKRNRMNLMGKLDSFSDKMQNGASKRPLPEIGDRPEVTGREQQGTMGSLSNMLGADKMPEIRCLRSVWSPSLMLGLLKQRGQYPPVTPTVGNGDGGNMLEQDPQAQEWYQMMQGKLQESGIGDFAPPASQYATQQYQQRPKRQRNPNDYEYRAAQKQSRGEFHTAQPQAQPERRGRGGHDFKMRRGKR